MRAALPGQQKHFRAGACPSARHLVSALFDESFRPGRLPYARRGSNETTMPRRCRVPTERSREWAEESVRREYCGAEDGRPENSAWKTDRFASSVAPVSPIPAVPGGSGVRVSGSLQIAVTALLLLA